MKKREIVMNATLTGGVTNGDPCIAPIALADVLEWALPREVLVMLLKDHTTGKNIVWGTKDYARQFGAGKCFDEWGTRSSRR